VDLAALIADGEADDAEHEDRGDEAGFLFHGVLLTGLGESVGNTGAGEQDLWR